jgi:hypothetical protein
MDKWIWTSIMFTRWYGTCFVATLALGSQPRQRLATVWAKSEAWESHSMLPGMWESVREWTFTLPSELPLWGVRVQMDSQIFKKQLQGSKLIVLWSSLYHWKVLGMKMFKMGSHDPYGYLKHKLGPKEASKVKLSIWLPIIKSQELP